MYFGERDADHFVESDAGLLEKRVSVCWAERAAVLFGPLCAVCLTAQEAAHSVKWSVVCFAGRIAARSAEHVVCFAERAAVRFAERAACFAERVAVRFAECAVCFAEQAAVRLEQGAAVLFEQRAAVRFGERFAVYPGNLCGGYAGCLNHCVDCDPKIIPPYLTVISSGSLSYHKIINVL